MRLLKDIWEHSLPGALYRRVTGNRPRRVKSQHPSLSARRFLTEDIRKVFVMYLSAGLGLGLLVGLPFGGVVGMLTVIGVALASAGVVAALRWSSTLSDKSGLGDVLAVDVPKSREDILQANLVDLEEREAASLLVEIQSARAHMMKALGSKFNPGEIIYERYSKSARQVYDASVSRLGDVAVHASHARERNTVVGETEAQISQRTSAWKDEVRYSIRVLDTTAAKLVAITTDTPSTDDLSSATRDLAELAEGAHRYDVGRKTG